MHEGPHASTTLLESFAKLVLPVSNVKFWGGRGWMTVNEGVSASCFCSQIACTELPLFDCKHSLQFSAVGRSAVTWECPAASWV